MFWIRLYAVEIRSTLYLVYGYAVSAQEQPSLWADSTLFEGGSDWRLRRFNCFLSEQDLAEIGHAAASGRVSISTKTDTAEIECSGLRQRPTVYADARTLISSGSPRSFSEDIAKLDAYWCLSKRALIEKLFAKSFSGIPDADARPLTSARNGQPRAIRRPREAEHLPADRQLTTQMHAVRWSGAFRVSHFLRSLTSNCGIADLVVCFCQYSPSARTRTSQLGQWYSVQLLGTSGVRASFDCANKTGDALDLFRRSVLIAS